ncbi:MAG: NAD(P)/FAD-dependent oxidoreductase [Bdellovibrionales bacterium]|nr:NAD(P)/FAD-dependent oxidoreductase [Bdellovibrionales bacterium]MBT3527166.1 NAD(P)/FAD-dependent oxidoreductase [Bdellovibrionales bacterium]MBT7669264.1 NAD(P)/FAD-dependent oxidoreductase [Bdellovibrionales bacterium]MBT7767567.1 NAD(P)/FAD-dependent oxidoreductase [Bdellovibrionales bacterium]
MISGKSYDVIIVGSGPAGLSAAVSLKKAGIKNVLVVEREPVAGGTVRHCGHRSFGLLEFQRLLTGANYAKKIREEAKKYEVQVKTKVTVTQYLPAGEIGFISPEESGTVSAKRVLITTGLREATRSARLVSGQRPMGVMTTAAFQSMIYLEDKLPCRRPVIVGSEIVSFSALMTAKHFKMKPVAMVENNSKMTFLPWVFNKIVSLFFTPLYLNSKVVGITGDQRVESVVIEDKRGERTKLPCDGVIFTGEFVSHSTLVKTSHLEIDNNTTSPEVDQDGRCSDSSYYATGNVLMPFKTGGKCWRLGRKIGRIIADDLKR